MRFCLPLFQRKHPDLYRNYEGSSPAKNQPLVATYVTSSTKYPANHPKQIKLNDALVSLIAENMLPLSHVESPA